MARAGSKGLVEIDIIGGGTVKWETFRTFCMDKLFSVMNGQLSLSLALSRSLSLSLAPSLSLSLFLSFSLSLFLSLSLLSFSLSSLLLGGPFVGPRMPAAVPDPKLRSVALPSRVLRRTSTHP